MTTTFDPANKLNSTLSSGNLVATATGIGTARGADGLAAGKYYFEITMTTIAGNAGVGVCNGDVNLAVTSGATAQTAVVLKSTGFAQVNGGNFGSSDGTMTNGTVVCCAADLDNKLIWFRFGAAGNWNGSASNNPATGVGGGSLAAIFPAYQHIYPFVSLTISGDNASANFGGSAFTGAVPSGFTSGWPSGSGVTTNLVATQVGAETWIGGGTPALTVTQLGAEVFFSMIPALVVTQIGAEVYFDQGSLVSPTSAQPMALIMA